MKQFVFILISIILLHSCTTTRQISYFQDAQINKQVPKKEGTYIRIQARDVLSIVVSSKNPQLSMLFNLPRISKVVGGSTASPQDDILGYAVDSKGYINFPVLGKIKIEGLTKEEIASLIKDTLIAQSLVKDPIVSVNFINLTFSVMGEVARPGQYNITKDQITILDALSMAGDLTIFGKRDYVFLTRENENSRITYQLDLRSTRIYDSPAFYIQQNDFIYVDPNKVKANQSTINGNNLLSASFWMSLASLLTTITVLFVK